MAKKNVTTEEPIEEVAIEATEPTVEPINWLANGWPSRDFFSPIPGVTDVQAAAAQDGGQEEA